MLENFHTHDILIIEDSIATIKLLGDYLEKLGYQNIHTCKDGKTGNKEIHGTFKLR